MEKVDKCVVEVGSQVEGYTVKSVQNWESAANNGFGPLGMCEIKWIMSLPKNRRRDKVNIDRGGCKVCHRGVEATLERTVAQATASQEVDHLEEIVVDRDLT